MRVVLTNHLKTRLKQRKIPIKTVKEVLKRDQENYWDNLRNHNIVVGKVNYQGKIKKALVAYDKIILPFAGKKRKITNILEIITIHPVTDEQIKQRLVSGRWSYEKKEE